MSILFRSNRCYNGGNKHNFEARYDEKPVDNLSIKRITGATTRDMYDIRKLTIYQEYLFDICTWCGEKIKR